MSVPIAVVGWVLKIRISSGVINEPPPMPVMPTSRPMPNPKRTIAGSMVISVAPHGVLIDFPDRLGQECGVRQDTNMRSQTGQIVGDEMVRPGPTEGADLAIAEIEHRFGEVHTIDRLSLSAAPHEVLGLVGPSGCGKSTLLELICGLREPGGGRIAVGGAEDAGERLSRCAYMPQRDLLMPWYSALDNAALALRNQGL